MSIEVLVERHVFVEALYRRIEGDRLFFALYLLFLDVAVELGGLGGDRVGLEPAGLVVDQFLSEST